MALYCQSTNHCPFHVMMICVIRPLHHQQLPLNILHALKCVCLSVIIDENRLPHYSVHVISDCTPYKQSPYYTAIDDTCYSIFKWVPHSNGSFIKVSYNIFGLSIIIVNQVQNWCECPSLFSSSYANCYYQYVNANLVFLVQLLLIWNSSGIWNWPGTPFSSMVIL